MILVHGRQVSENLLWGRVRGGSPRSRNPKGVGQFSGATDDDEVVLMACLVNCCVFYS